MMLRYIVASAATGEILRTPACLPGSVAAQAGDGEVLIESVDATRHTHYVAAGALVAYTTEQAQAKAVRPPWAADWDNAAMAWTDPRTLADLKAEKWAEIKAARDASEFGGYTWDGSAFDSDAQSQSRIMGAVQMATLAAAASQPFQIDWTLTDNSVRTLDGSEMIAAGLQLGTHVGTAHAIARVLRDQLVDATTPAAVEAIAWP